MSIGNSIRHGTKWLFGGNVAGQALQFAFGIALARLLVPADFGTLVTVQIFTGLASFLAAGGMGQALIRAQDSKIGDYQVAFTIQLIVGLLVYTAFFVTSPLFARWYGEPLYVELFRVSAITFILRPFSNMPNAWLTREMRFKQRIMIDLVCGVLGSVLAVVLAWLQFGVWSLVFGGIAGTLLSIVALTIVTPVRPGFRFDATLTKALGLYSLRFTSNDFVSYVRSQTPNFFLGQLQGPASVGLFNKADSLAKTPRIVAGSVYDPIFRMLATSQDNLDQSRYIYFRTVTLLSVYMSPLFIGLAWLSRPFIFVVYGEKWLAVAEPLSILSIAGILACIGYPSGAVLAARNWLGREIFVHLIQIVLFAASCLIGIQWGITGVAWGILLSEAISVLFIAFLVKQCLQSRFSHLFASLVPGAILNILLCGTLAILDFALPPGFNEARPLSYMLIMSCAGSLIYALAFLFIPIPSLASESLRWKKIFRLNFASR